MKKYNLLLMALLVAMAVTGCKKGPMYIYVDKLGDEPKVSFIDAEDDNGAYNKAFEKYSEARFYPIFSEFEKTYRFIKENEGNSEACEGDESTAVPPDDSNGRGSVITTGDDVNTLEGMGQEPTYESLSKDNTPNFVLYKIEDGKARKAAQDLIDKKISYEEFEKIISGTTESINLYDKSFESCATIDRNMFEKLRNKLRSAKAQIDKEAEARKAEGDTTNVRN